MISCSTRPAGILVKNPVDSGPSSIALQPVGRLERLDEGRLVWLTFDLRGQGT